MVDAPASGAGILTGVEVRVFSWAPKINNIPHGLNLAEFLLLPEGGLAMATADGKTTIHFNTQPPEGGWFQREMPDLLLEVSTHSHPKVAAVRAPHFLSGAGVSTHSHPKVAAPTSQTARLQMPFQHTATRRWLLVLLFSKDLQQVSTHSHPKVADNRRGAVFQIAVSTHSHPKVAARLSGWWRMREGFQHTATRRWLLGSFELFLERQGFNTQPPEGGW